MHWFFKVSFILIGFWFLVVFVLFIRPRLLSEEKVINKEVYGIILVNQRWGGTVKVVGDLYVVPGAKIEVEPGTQILVATAGDKSNHDLIPIHQKSGINSLGEIVEQTRPGEPFLDEGQKISLRLNRFYANGTREQPIIVASDTKTPSPYDFNKIYVSAGVLKNIHFSNFRRLEIADKVSVIDSTFSDIGECAICVTKGNPNIFNNIFIRSLRNHIYVYKSSPRISNNLFLPIKGDGIVVSPARRSQIQIMNNEFQLPGHNAIYFTAGEKIGGVASQNLFASGDIKIPCDSKLQIIQNHIKSNIVFDKSGNCVGSIILGLNYWEISDSKKVLESRIVGTEPDFQVKILGVLKKPPDKVGKSE